MANFEKAFNKLIKIEGKYVNDPDDPGGETNYGISKRSYPNLDIRSLTKDDAKRIYLKDFWSVLGCHQIQSDILASQLFDFGVNAGTETAARMLQTILNKYFPGNSLSVDGLIGPLTLEKMSALTPVGLYDLSKSYKLGRIDYYMQICAIRKESKKFLYSWVRRVIYI
jgi:lysozyme family protein